MMLFLFLNFQTEMTKMPHLAFLLFLCFCKFFSFSTRNKQVSLWTRLVTKKFWCQSWNHIFVKPPLFWNCRNHFLYWRASRSVWPDVGIKRSPNCSHDSFYWLVISINWSKWRTLWVSVLYPSQQHARLNVARCHATFKLRFIFNPFVRITAFKIILIFGGKYREDCFEEKGPLTRMLFRPYNSSSKKYFHIKRTSVIRLFFFDIWPFVAMTYFAQWH